MISSNYHRKRIQLLYKCTAPKPRRTSFSYLMEDHLLSTFSYVGFFLQSLQKNLSISKFKYWIQFSVMFHLFNFIWDISYYKNINKSTKPVLKQLFHLQVILVYMSLNILFINTKTFLNIISTNIFNSTVSSALHKQLSSRNNTLWLPIGILL